MAGTEEAGAGAAGSSPPVPPAAALSSRRLAEVFASLDRDGKGCIRHDELRLALSQLGIPAPATHTAHLFDTHDTDTSKSIDFGEFELFVAHRTAVLRRTFDELDHNADGRLCFRDLMTAVRRLRLDITREQVEELIRRADTDYDGHVGFSEFCHLLLLVPGDDPRAFFDQLESLHIIANGVSEYDYMGYQEDAPHETTTRLAFGAMASVISRTSVAPLDRCRIVMQASDRRLNLWSRLTSGGLRAQFRGNLANLLKIVPDTLVMFLVYDFLRERSSNPDNPTFGEKVAISASAGAAASSVMYPLDLARTRLALSSDGLTLRQFFQGTLQKQGVRGFYSGWSMALAGGVPFGLVNMVSHGIFRDHILSHRSHGPGGGQRSQQGTLPLMLAGASACTLASMLATYPIAMVRTRLQARGLDGQPTYSGPLDCARKIFAEGGARAFYRGVLPSAARVIPATFVSYAVYSQLEDNFDFDY